MSQERYTTIKIRTETHPKLKILAAQTGESMLDLIDRLVKQEQTTMQGIHIRNQWRAEDLAREGFEVYLNQYTGFWVRTDNVDRDTYQYKLYRTGNQIQKIPDGSMRYYAPQEASTMTHTYTVIEDNGGGLHLFIWDEFDDDNAPSYAFHGFEFNPGTLVAALDDLDAGGDPAMWDGASETPVADWMAGTDGKPGYTVVCHNLDGERVLLTDKMGTAAQIEFGIEPA